LTWCIADVIKVAGRHIGTVVRIVADAVSVDIGAATAADATGIDLVAEAIAVTGRDAGSAAHAAFVERGAGPVGRVIEVAGGDVAAVVHGIAQAITVGVHAGSTAVATSVQLIAEAIAVAGRNAASAAYAALIGVGTGHVAGIIEVAGRDIGAVIRIIAHAVAIGIRSTGATTDAKGVELVARAVAVARQDARTAADATLVEGGTRAIGCIVVVAGRHVGTVVLIVAEAVGIDVRAVPATDTAGVRLVAETVAIAGRDAGAAADAALIELQAGAIGRVGVVAGRQVGAIVLIVADAVTVHVGAGAATVAAGVELVAEAIAVASRDAGSTANTAFIEERTCTVGGVCEVAGRRVGAVVGIVADAVRIHVRGAGAATDAEDVLHIAVAVAFAGRDSITATDAALINFGAGLVGRVVVVAGRHVGAVVRIVAQAVEVNIDAASTADAAHIDLVAEAIAVAGRDAGSATHATLVERGASPIGRVIVVAGADIAAVVVGVADAVTIGVDSGSATVATSVELVAEAVAVAGRDAGSTANAALVELGTSRVGCIIVVAGRHIGTVVGVVADAVSVDVGGAGTTTDTEGVELVAGAIAVTGRDAGTTAHTACIERGAGTVGCIAVVAGRHVGAIVRTVADAVRIRIRAIASAYTAGIFLVAEAIAVAGRDAGTTADAALVELQAAAVRSVRVIAGRQIGAVVNVVADAICIAVHAGSAADTAVVELVAEAIAVTGRDAAAATNTTGIHLSTGGVARIVVVACAQVEAVVNVVTNAVRIGVRRAGASALTEGVQLVAITVAITCRDAAASADAAGVQLGARCIGWVGVVAGRDVGTVVRIVADAVRVHVHAASAAHAASVLHIAEAVAIPSRDTVSAAYATLIDELARTIGGVIEVAGGEVGTVVLVVADAVAVGIGQAHRHSETGGRRIAVDVGGRVGHRRHAFGEVVTRIRRAREGGQTAIVSGSRLGP